ncbi:MAG: hypothetical protein J1F06_06790 [Prevotellaceae bacterium]|nr:hypothetical protein [Prevotellaceae bacterium]
MVKSKQMMNVRIMKANSRTVVAGLAIFLSLFCFRAYGQSADGAIVLSEDAIIFCSFKIFKTSYTSGTIQLDDTHGRFYDFFL